MLTLGWLFAFAAAAPKTHVSSAQDLFSPSLAHNVNLAGRCGGNGESLLQQRTTHSQTHDTKEQNARLTPLASETTLAEKVANIDDSMLAMRHAVHSEGEFSSANDLTNLVSSLIFNGSIVFCHILFFCLVRFHHPKLFANGWLMGRAPYSPGESLFGWVVASWRVSTEEVIEAAGLDAAMLLRYQDLVMKILMVIGIPLIFVMCPLHYNYGGAMQTDPLSRVDMLNIVDGSWLFWIHALITWAVVILVQRLLVKAQTEFVELRYEWLRKLPAPRATTCLVQSIPEEFRSDEKLKSYVNDIFTNDAVECAYVIRKLPDSLTCAFSAVQAQREQLRNAEANWQSSGEDPEERPKHFTAEGAEVDSIDHFRSETKRLAVELENEQILVEAKAKVGDLDFCTCDGFVTFKRRHDCEVALGMRARAKADEIMFSSPPGPMEVQYEAFQHDSRWKRRVLGYLLISVLFFSYLPVVTALAYLTRLGTLSRFIPAFNVIVSKYPIVTSLWDGVVGSFLLTLFIGFVPTFLMLAIKGFFALPAESWCQHQLQQWYFLFQVTFVLLIFCIGNSLFSTTLKLVKNPTRIFSLLASTLPQTAHFYLNFFPLQWVSHCCQLARYWNLIMYYYNRTKVDSDLAYEFSQLEDQDYYGIGARSARTSLLFVIALVFSSVSPIICLMALVSFLYSRVIFGYLLVFTESKKPDTGGLYWCAQLKHILHGLFLYITLMVGLLCEKAGAYGPGFFTSLCYIFLMDSYVRFDKHFHWMSLPIEEIVALESSNEKSESNGRYIQPELVLQS